MSGVYVPLSELVRQPGSPSRSTWMRRIKAGKVETKKEGGRILVKVDGSESDGSIAVPFEEVEEKSSTQDASTVSGGESFTIMRELLKEVQRLTAENALLKADNKALKGLLPEGEEKPSGGEYGGADVSNVSASRKGSRASWWKSEAAFWILVFILASGGVAAALML